MNRRPFTIRRLLGFVLLAAVVVTPVFPGASIQAQADHSTPGIVSPLTPHWSDHPNRPGGQTASTGHQWQSPSQTQLLSNNFSTAPLQQALLFPPALPLGQVPSLLNLAGTISGKVMDAGGMGIPNMKVSVGGSGYGSGACTDGQGNYTIPALPLDLALRIEAAPAGFNDCPGGSNAYAQQYWNHTTDWGKAEVVTLTSSNPAVTGINFNLDPGGGISGHVYQQDGTTPVVGSCLVVASKPTDLSQGVKSMPTGSDGSFSFYGVPTGSMYVIAFADCIGSGANLMNEWYALGGSTPDWQNASPVTIAAGQLTTGIDFQLDPAGRISGKVMGAQGTAIPNMKVSVGGPGYGSAACTDGQGNYTFATLPFNMELRVEAAPVGVNDCAGGSNAYAHQYWNHVLYWEQATLVSVSQNQPALTGIDFNLAAGGGITGHVYQQDGGAPVAGACFVVADSTSGWPQLAKSSPTGKDGSFAFYGIPTGPVYMIAYADCTGSGSDLLNEWYAAGGSTPDPAQATPITITAGQLASGVDFQLDTGGSISGHVYKQDGTTVLGGVNVQICIKDCSSAIRQATTDEDGAYILHGVAGGQYMALAHLDGYEDQYYSNGFSWFSATQISVTPPAQITGINFALSAPTTAPTGEQAALVNLYNTNGGANWKDQQGWLSDPNACKWSHITCQAGHVVGLDFYYGNLTGTIPDLSALSALRSLDLGGNQLTGSVPASLGSLVHLQWLYLDDNQLSGSLPDSLANLSAINDFGVGSIITDSLDLAWNRLAVPVPYPTDPPTPLQQFLIAKDPDWQYRQSISASVPATGATLVSTDGGTTIVFPAGSLPQATIFEYIPQRNQQHDAGALASTGHNFTLSALDAFGKPIEPFTFLKPITITLQFKDEDVKGIALQTLKIYYWDTAKNGWRDIASTCTPTSTYSINQAQHSLSVAVCHLSEFTLLGAHLTDMKSIFVPMLRR